MELGKDSNEAGAGITKTLHNAAQGPHTRGSRSLHISRTFSRNYTYTQYTAKMRLTTDLINNSLSFINCLTERELDLRGALKGTDTTLES